MISVPQVRPVEGDPALDSVRILLQEYWDSFGFTPCFQNFADELSGLPGAYAPRDGRLAMATVDSELAGCVALRRVDELRAEAKRLYVRPAFRGLGLGRALIEWAMFEARIAGYRELVGDTMPAMRDALALYDRIGFERGNHTQKTPPKVRSSFALSCRRIRGFSLSASAPRYSDWVTDKLLLITLLVKLGVVGSVASILARASSFRRLFFAEQRRPRQTLALLAFFLVPLTLGVWIRLVVPNFLAADISFETVILLGLLIGPGWAMLSGAVLSLPAVLHHEYLALPFNIALGLAAGTIRRFVEKEEVWSFTPFIDLSLYRWVRRNLIKPRIDRQILLLVVIAVMEMIRDWIAAAFPHRLFALLATNLWFQALVWLSAPIVVGIALKVWNALRVEMSLEEQKRLVLEARLDALQRQINPHFLFNTLNSIASLVRSKPEMAREMTVKLANILRALLKDHDAYVPLRDELKFTDDYLDIEVVRFGADKLRVEKEIDPRTLEVLVPSILLQPLIENSIKHGLEPRLHGGTITLRSRLEGNRVSIEVADDGVGMHSGSVSSIRRQGAGIGMKNVQERLEVLYGDQAHFKIESNPGRGTSISIEIPANINGIL